MTLYWGVVRAQNFDTPIGVTTTPLFKQCIYSENCGITELLVNITVLSTSYFQSCSVHHCAATVLTGEFVRCFLPDHIQHHQLAMYSQQFQTPLRIQPSLLLMIESSNEDKQMIYSRPYLNKLIPKTSKFTEGFRANNSGDNCSVYRMYQNITVASQLVHHLI